MSDERRISEAAVKKATGQGWAHWLALLDRWGAAAKGHTATAKHLQERHGLPTWWAQTVTVRFEKERGLRELNQVRGGYQISVSRSIDCTPARAWEAWTCARELNRWFGEHARINLREGGRYDLGGGDVGVYRSIEAPTRLRFTWDNALHSPGSLVEVRFAPKVLKSGRRTVVTLQHRNIPTKRGAADLREGWSWAMDSLRAYLETGERIAWEAWKAARKG